MDRLKYALQALAQPGCVQLTLFPDFVVKADELLLDFDNWYWIADVSQFNSVQQQALSDLDAQITAQGETALRTGDESYFAEEGLLDHPGWENIRRMARNCLQVLGWPEEVPPTGLDTYIRGW